MLGARSRRLTIGLAVAAATLVVLAGCEFYDPTPDPTPTATATAGPAPSDLDGFYTQQLEWSSCGDGLECATALAPIDWDAPSDGSIELALVRHPATGVAQGSLLLNPGGPGGSGWDYVAQSGEFVATEAVVENFDVVGWDPRGVGRSTPVTCYTDSDEKDALLYGTFSAEYGTDEWLDDLTEETEDFGEACLAGTGDLLAHLDTASNAKDMDMLRAALGDEKLNYLGYSYGTYFGTVYAELFPENVGRLVLDGALDPTLSDFESLKVQMAGFEGAFRAYLDDCLDSGECPFTGTLEEALDQVDSVLATVDDLELENTDGRILDSATMGTAIALNLYSESYWPDMTAMFEALSDGDPSLAFQSADYYNSRNPDGTYSSNSVDVYIAATCVDGDFVEDSASTLERIAQIDKAAPTIGKYLAYDDFAVLDTACTHWPVPRADLPTSFEAKGAAPILVIGTTNDPATPYAWAKALAKQLDSGVLVSYEGEGHTVYNQGVTCIDDVVDAYLVDGEVPSTDPEC
jgi:pimeloyl-ACP methyl ester carboxylesterase